MKDKIEEKLKELENLRDIHRENAKEYSYKHLILNRHCLPNNDLGKCEAFLHHGLSEGYSRAIFALRDLAGQAT